MGFEADARKHLEELKVILRNKGTTTPIIDGQPDPSKDYDKDAQYHESEITEDDLITLIFNTACGYLDSFSFDRSAVLKEIRNNPHWQQILQALQDKKDITEKGWKDAKELLDSLSKERQEIIRLEIKLQENPKLKAEIEELKHDINRNSKRLVEFQQENQSLKQLQKRIEEPREFVRQIILSKKSPNMDSEKYLYAVQHFCQQLLKGDKPRISSV